MQKFRSFFFILGKIGDCFAFLSKNYLQARDVLYAVKLTNICSSLGKIGREISFLEKERERKHKDL